MNLACDAVTKSNWEANSLNGWGNVFPPRKSFPINIKDSVRLWLLAKSKFALKLRILWKLLQKPMIFRKIR